jgi:hypothetical protein
MTNPQPQTSQTASPETPASPKPTQPVPNPKQFQKPNPAMLSNKVRNNMNLRGPNQAVFRRVTPGR